MKLVRRALFGMLCMLAASTAHAQVQTGSIAGVATDTSNAVMPGVAVSVSGDKLIGGVQTQVTDASGAYRFDRLPPGSYTSGAVILLSDGRRTTGPDPLEAAKLAADRGVRVYTVGFGTKEGGLIGGEEWSFYVRLDEETLKSVAAITGAEYFYAGTAEDLKKVYQNLQLKIGLEKKDTEIGAFFSALTALLVVLAAVLSMLWFHRRT